jgi:addiction module HigA family antidote
MEMFNPPHPGESVREDCLKPLKLTVTAAAASLGVSRQSMSELLNGRNGISADMALRLEKAGWGSAEAWMRNQTAYDLWQARHRDEAPGSRARLKAHRKTNQPKPAVPPQKSFTPDYIICLEDGRKFKSLKRHLRTRYNLSPEEYREKWGLPSDYPMVAPAYAKARSALAKQMGISKRRA